MINLTIWHDGDCPLCRIEMAAMRRLDTRGAIHFVDAASCPIDRRALLARFHAREDGQLLSGAAAFAAIGLLARSPMVLRMLEAAYRGFLRVRPALQQAFRRVAPT